MNAIDTDELPTSLSRRAGTGSALGSKPASGAGALSRGGPSRSGMPQ